MDLNAILARMIPVDLAADDDHPSVDVA